MYIFKGTLTFSFLVVLLTASLPLHAAEHAAPAAHKKPAAASHAEHSPSPTGAGHDESTTSTESVITEKKEVYISGKKVMTKHTTGEKLSSNQILNLPPELNTEAIKTTIQQRRHMQIYNHNPSIGKADAPVTIIELSDLSCLQCYKILKEVDKVRAKYADKVRYIHIHLPVDPYNTSNPAAFYGRLAHQSGVFWKYRELLLDLTEINENTFSEKLIEAGVDVKRLRTLIRKNARQFYKELDADSMLSRKMTETQPPAIYVNGIRVGMRIPFESLEALIQYEISEQEKSQL